MRIAAEGISFILISMGLSVLSWGGFKLFPAITIVPGLIFTILTIIIIFFFRDPLRVSPIGDNLILSPADGTVLPFGEYIAEDGRKQRMVSIFLSLFDVHVNRSPVSGEVSKLEYCPGRFVIASHKEASRVNEMNRVTINCNCGKFIFQQVAGAIARRVVCHLKEGQDVIAGQRIGIMKFGSRMDLILPENIEIKIRPGNKVCAGLSIIGVWQSEQK